MAGLQQFVAFAETDRHGGFAAAAREQGVAPSTLAKAVARLELSLGVKLFHRTTRQVTLTPDGEWLYQRCQRVLAEVEDLQAEASGARAQPAGTLRVDLPVFYGRRFVLPLLAARGTPRRLEDLANHAAIVFRPPSTGRDRPWQFRQRGVPVELPAPVRVRIDETESLVDALKLGLGMCQLPDMLVQGELARGERVELLPSCRPEPMPIHVLRPPGRLVPARVQAALQALDALRQRTRGAWPHLRPVREYAAPGRRTPGWC